MSVCVCVCESQVAVLNNHEELVKLLLDGGADYHVKNEVTHTYTRTNIHTHTHAQTYTYIQLSHVNEGLR